MIDTIDRKARFYDKPDTFDRFTCVYLKRQPGDYFLYRGASHNPFHPCGFGQWGDSKLPIDRVSRIPRVGGFNHLGKRIRFADLPEDVQKLVIKDLEDM